MLLPLRSSIACCAVPALLCLCNCNSPANNNKTNNDTLATIVPSTADTLMPDVYDEYTDDYAIVYVVVADTGQDYYPLQRAMYGLSSQLSIPIDTMNRYYNAQKNEIVLADDDEDEMYRGEYFPRRFASAVLSLEYYRIYNDTTTDKNIALVAGTYEAAKSADSALALLRPLAPRSFGKVARIYVGCMH